MKKYFKDQKFLLIYSHSENGISVNKISESIIDQNSKLLIIAARGDEPKTGEYYVDNGYHFDKIENDENSLYSLYSAYKNRSSEQVLMESELEKDLEVDKFLEDLATFVEGQVVTKLITLAFDEGSQVVESKNSNIKLIKRGGVELVVEFMLSNFINESYKGWFYKSDGRPLESKNFNRIVISSDPELQAIHSWGEIPFSKKEISELEERWHYDYTLSSDLYAINGIEYPDDPEYDLIKYLYKFNIDGKKLKKLNKRIEIPYRVYEILTSEQKQLLSNQVYGIILDVVDDVGRDLFGLNFDSFANDEKYQNSIVASRQWGAELHGLMGGGSGSLYLGDGMSLDSKGNLTDD